MKDRAVFVFALVEPAADTPKNKRRFKVRWRVSGRDRKRTFRSKTEAERFRTRLQHSVLEGELFDLESGLPAAWSDSEESWWTWSRTWLGLKWPGWSGNSRRNGVESLVAITPHMVRRRAPVAPPGLSTWLREIGFVRGAQISPDDPCARWLERNSIVLSELG